MPRFSVLSRQFSIFRQDISRREARGFTLIRLPLLGKRSCQGFTLIELMVAISIIAILSALGLVAYTRVQQNARDARRAQDIDAMIQAVNVYGQNNNGNIFATTNGTVAVQLAGLVPPYLNKVPEDPSCSANYPCYQYVSDGVKYGIWVRFENPPANATVTCANNGFGSAPTAVNSLTYNYCVSP